MQSAAERVPWHLQVLKACLPLSYPRQEKLGRLGSGGQTYHVS